MMSPSQTRTVLLSIVLGAGGLFGCEDDAKSVPVDATVDAGPECEPGSVGQETCKTVYGEQYFCTEEGTCAELEPCETVDCCSPGSEGDQYCVGLCQLPDNCPDGQEIYGAGSQCMSGEGNGTCTERACLGCSYDDAGHGCCSEALGTNWFCGASGRCIESAPCAADDCCTPGTQGDAFCASGFGEGSTCALVGNSGQCLRSQAPPCADCRDDDGGHACCSAEFGERWFCSESEGICRQTSGCELDQCCVPGADGDTGCRERFGTDSSCTIMDRDGRCLPG
jgi:hypothetical protein